MTPNKSIKTRPADLARNRQKHQHETYIRRPVTTNPMVRGAIFPAGSGMTRAEIIWNREGGQGGSESRDWGARRGGGYIPASTWRCGYRRQRWRRRPYRWRGPARRRGIGSWGAPGAASASRSPWLEEDVSLGNSGKNEEEEGEGRGLFLRI